MDLLKPPPPLKLSPLQKAARVGPVGIFGITFCIYVTIGILFSNHNQQTDLWIEAANQIMFFSSVIVSGLWYLIAPEAGSKKRLEERHPEYQIWKELTNPHKVSQYEVAIEELEPEGAEQGKLVEVCLVEKRSYNLKVLEHQAFKGNDPDTVERALDYKIGLEKQADQLNLKAREAYMERLELDRETESLYKLLSGN